MAARPYWKGHLRLSLVALPVQLHSATSRGGRIAFHQIHRPTGERVRHQKVVPGVGPVEADEIVKGIEVAKGEYVTLEDSEIEAIRLESRHTIDLVQFVDPHEIDPLYFERPYFVVPDGAVAQEAYRVIRQALADTRKVALGQIVLAGRQSLVALQPCGRGMLLETLRSADEIKKGSPYFAEIEEGPIDDDQLALARELVRRKSAPFDPGQFVDQYEAALRELIAAKTAGRKVGRAPTPATAKVVDLMQALKQSLAEDRPKPAARRPAQVHDHPAKKRAATKSSRSAKDRASPPARARKSA